MESDFGNTENIDAIADAFIVSSLESFNAHGDLTDDAHPLAMWSTLQEIIDHVNDHNELMLEAISTISNDVSVWIESLMLVENDEDATLAWQHSMNACFNAVKRRLER